MFDITSNKLRFYEKKGLISPARNKINGYREFNDQDILTIQLILSYRIFDIPIEEIKKIIYESDTVSLEQELIKQLNYCRFQIKHQEIISA